MWTLALALPADGPFAVLSIGEAAPLEAPAGDEAAWASAALRGDRRAFGRLVERHGRSVLGLCVRLLREREEGRDAAQEAFARAWAGLAGFDAAQPFGPWLLRIARNHCLDLLRRRPGPAEREELDLDGEARGVADASVVAADDLLARRELAASIERAVAALPARYREVVHLFHVEQLAYRDIALVLDVPVGTVMTWLHRARAQLRGRLAAEREEGLP